MLKIEKIIFILLLCFGLSFNQTYAQETPATAVLNETLSTVKTPPLIAPVVPTTTGPAVPQSPDSNATLGAITIGAGKYEEYQSICRRNEYDLIVHYSNELKEKRVDFLKDKIVDAGDKAIKFELRLVKEYIDQNEDKKLAVLVATLKEKKLATFDNEYLNALIAISTKNFSLARTILNKLLVGSENNIEVLRLLAEVYLAEENYFEASAIYEDLNKLTKNSYLVQHCQALVLNSYNADGENLCLQAARKFPDDPFAFIYIGISHRERGDFKNALSSFKKSVAIKPTEMGFTCLAEILYIKENFKEAIVNFKQSIKFNPHSERAVLGLAWTELKQKNYTEAMQAFKEACKMNSKNVIEIRKVFKLLHSEKIPEAKKFIQLTDSCGR